jgi:NAD/NADP transhydrogenase beta subunit
VVQHAVLEDPDAKQYVAILLGLVEGVVAGVRAARQCRVAVAPQVANLRSSSMVGLSDSTELHSSHTRELCTGM